MKLREVAERLACRLEGDGEIEILRVAGIEQAGEHDLTFLANPRYTGAMSKTRAAAIIVAEDAAPAPCAMLRTDQPYLAFATAVALFHPSPSPPPGIDARAAIAPDATLGEAVSIGPFVVISAKAKVGARTIVHPGVVIGADVHIGEDCVIHAHASLRERVVIGNRVVVQDGAVVGSDGYGFVRRPDGSYQKIPQVSTVVIEDDVEIGANTTIDRPAVGETRIQRGAKLDNLVQIAHGVSVGRNTMLAAQVGIAGSTRIGDDVVLAGQVGIAGHLEIGNGTVATAQSGVPNSVAPGAFISGYPAIANREWLKASAIFRRLPELKKSVVELQRRVAELEAQVAEAGKRRV